MTPLPTHEFCEQLFTRGVLTAERWRPIHSDQPSAVHALIRRADHLARLDAPAQAPTLDLTAAQWSLSLLAWSVSLLVDRANASTRLPIELVNSEPKGDSTSHHWSVDLAFRYLGDVWLRAKSAASEDALVVEIANVAARWPLSVVGTTVPWNAARGHLILDDRCLHQLLLDRVAARNDQHLNLQKATLYRA